jgi:hypothetical protein
MTPGLLSSRQQQECSAGDKDPDSNPAEEFVNVAVSEREVENAEKKSSRGESI